jgi:amidase
MEKEALRGMGRLKSWGCTPAYMGVVLVLATAVHAQPPRPQVPMKEPPPSDAAVAEATVEALQAHIDAGRLTSREIVRRSLQRITLLDKGGPKLNSMLELNPDALETADSLDRSRKTLLRGPLHGIPIVIKDNIDTGDSMKTSAGSLALMDAPAARDAFIVRKLRNAGAVIVGKTNLSEWANIRSTKSTSGWSARGGLTRNAYDPTRNPCGSSSGTGTAIAAGFATVGIGTETDGSIMCPSSMAGLVGVKPTVGLVSRSGIIPISHSQDTAGPMTRRVADAAIVLSIIAGVDPEDPATHAAKGHVSDDYRKFLNKDGLKGARIGVARKKVTGYSQHTDRLFELAIADLKRMGAVIVDPADFKSLGEYDDDELEVLLYELKDGLNKYLAQRPGLKVRTLADVIAFNERNADREMPYFGQELFVRAQAKGPLSESKYRKALERARKLARDGIDKVLQEHKLDAIIAPTGSPAWVTDLVNGDSYLGSSSTPAAVAGYPSITVPMGSVQGLPVGLSFVGTAWSEGQLLRLAYAYEQGTMHRRPPPLEAQPNAAAGAPKAASAPAKPASRK